MRKYKLAIVTTHIIQYAVPLYKKINAHPEVDLTIIFCSDKGLAAHNDPGFGVEYAWDSIDLSGLKYRFLRNYSLFPSVSRFFGLFNPGIIKSLKEERYDAIVIPGYFTASYWLAFYISKVTKTPFILSGEPPSPYKSQFKKIVVNPFKKIVLRWLVDNASAILYIGKKSQEYYLSYRKNIKNKMFFCPYSVDNDYYFSKAREYRESKMQLKEMLGIPKDLPVILFLSKLTRWKQPMLLLKAYRKLKTPASLVYVGSGYRYKELIRYAKNNNLKNAFFFGFQNYSQIPKFYAISDILAFPSLGESWGLVVNEAMCFGLPIVTTNKVMSTFDLVVDGENGYILTTENTEDFKGILDNLLDNPVRRQKMGEKSRQLIKNWNYDKYTEGLLNALAFIRGK